MKTIEEQLWDYIDGNCTASERADLENKIAIDLSYQAIYQDLLAVNLSLQQLDFEAPSLSFTRNVMEKVHQELRPVALTTKIDKRVVYAIGALFGISILAVFSYAISISSAKFEMPSFTIDVENMFTPLALQVFALVDVVLALVYLDSLLRKNKLGRATSISSPQSPS